MVYSGVGSLVLIKLCQHYLYLMDMSHDLVGRVTLFAEVFDWKPCNEKLTIPRTCFPKYKLVLLFGLEKECY